VMNMDGLEWKRKKYSKVTRKFLLYAERLGVKFSDALIADSPAIQTYLKKKYDVDSEYIAYGAEIFNEASEELLTEYEVQKYDYFVIIARMEPENNIATILEGFSESNSTKKLLIVGNTNNSFGSNLLRKYEKDARIRFLGPIFNARTIHSIKFFSFMYFHGHSVGGTNPSLLEAMASQSLIIAHDNPFNRAILDKDAFYFASAREVKHIVESHSRGEAELEMIRKNLEKIKTQFRWDQIIERYENYIYKCLANGSS
jgi:glycosyltransferase involved in cell wall biosynthesis